jgi:hypothetical protein
LVFGFWGLAERCIKQIKRVWGPDSRSMPPPTQPNSAPHAVRWVLTFLAASLCAPWLFSGPKFGVVDLLAMSVPFWCVVAGAAMGRFLSAALATAGPLRALPPLGRASAAVLLGLFFLTPSAITSGRNYHTAEAYRTLLLGGAPGCAELGFSRYHEAPFPLPVAKLLEARAHSGPSTIAFMGDQRRSKRILGLYLKEGLVTKLPRWTSQKSAEILVLTHDNTDPNHSGLNTSFESIVPTDRTAVLRNGGLRIITVGFRQRER